MTERTLWSPEDIAALVDGLVDDAAERARLEETIRTDAEAARWAEALREDVLALDHAVHLRLDATPAEEFRRAVLEHLEPPDFPGWRLLIGALRRRWQAITVGLAVIFALVVALNVPREDGPGAVAERPGSSPDVSVRDGGPRMDQVPRTAVAESGATAVPSAVSPEPSLLTGVPPPVGWDVTGGYPLYPDYLALETSLDAGAYEIAFESVESIDILRVGLEHLTFQSPFASLFSGAAVFRVDITEADLTIAVRSGLVRLSARGGFLDVAEGEMARATATALARVEPTDVAPVVAAVAPVAPRPGPLVTGRVTDATGQPLAEATVLLRAHVREAPTWGFATLDARVAGFDGSFAFEDPFAMAREQGLGDRALFLMAQHPGRATLQIELSDLSPAQEIAFALPPGHGLRGVVVDEAGRPLEGVRVRASEVEYTRAHQSRLGVVSGPGGQFAFTDLTETDHLITLIGPAGVPEPMGVMRPGVDPVWLTRRAAPEFAVVGVVSGALTLDPAAGEIVTLSADVAGLENPRTLAWAPTEDGGTFHFTGLAPGFDYRVEVESHFAHSLIVDVQGEPWSAGPLTLTAETPVAHVSLIGGESMWLRGQVQDLASAAAVPNVDVVVGWNGQMHTADGEGWFVVEGFEPRIDVLFSIESPVWTIVEEGSFSFLRQRRVDMEDLLEDIVLPVERGRPLTGEVLDSIGLPVPGVAIRLAEVGGGFSTRIARTDDRGRFASAISPDRRDFTLFAQAEGWPLAIFPLTIETDAAAWEPVRIIFPPPRRLEAQVVDAAGEPVPDALIILDPALPSAPDRVLTDPGLSLHGETNQEGVAVIENLPDAPMRATILRGTEQHADRIGLEEMTGETVRHTFVLD